jgi:hypothetical protein
VDQEIQLIRDELSVRPFEDIMYETSENFIEMRSSIRKQHFGEKVNFRDRAIKLAACCMVIVEQIDKEDVL